MNLLYPGMLIGLIGLAVPTVLHLIARHKYPVVDFPAVRLLRPERRANVFAARFVDIPQLLLRLLVALLAVLAMSRLLLPGGAAPAPYNRVVVLDGSASMRMLTDTVVDGQRQRLFDRARLQAMQLLRQVSPPGQTAVVFAGRMPDVLVPLSLDAEQAARALATREPLDGRGGGLVSAVLRACELVRGRREMRSQILVLTDGRASAFGIRSRIDRRRIESIRAQMGPALELVFVDVSPQAPANVAIVDGRVRGSEVRLGEDAHVLARLRNFGTAEIEANLRLSIAGQRVPATRSLTLPPDADTVVDLTARMRRAIRSFATVTLKAEDDAPADNAFDASLSVTDMHHVLIVDGEADRGRSVGAATALTGLGDGGVSTPEAEAYAGPGSATLLRYAINPKREAGQAGGSGIDATLVTPDALAGQPLGRYEVIYLVGVDTLSERSLADVRSFVRDGRSLVVVCSAGADAMRFNRVFGPTGDTEGLAPFALGLDAPCDPPLRIDVNALDHPVFEAPDADLAAGLSVVRFHRVRQFRDMKAGVSVLMRGADGRPLLVEKRLGKGRLVCLAFGFELARGNLSRTRMFPTFVVRLTRYLLNALETGADEAFVAGRPAALQVDDPAFAFLRQLTLSSADPQQAFAPLPLALGADRSLALPPLPRGRYLLHKPRSDDNPARQILRGRPVAVNPDPVESELTPATSEDLASAFGIPLREAALEEAEGLFPRGRELWTLVVVLLFAAYAAEAIYGHWTTRRRESEFEETA